MKRFIAFAPLALLALLVVVGVVMLTRGGGERELFTTGEEGARRQRTRSHVSIAALC